MTDPEAPRPADPEGELPPHSGGRGPLDQFRRGGKFERLGDEIKEKAVTAKGKVQDWAEAFKDRVSEFGHYLHEQFVPELDAVAKGTTESEELKRHYQEIPRAMQKIIVDIIPGNQVLPRQTPLIAALVELSMGKDESKAHDMEDILRGIYELYDMHVLDSDLGKKILKKLYATIEEKGFKGEISQELVERVEIATGLRDLPADSGSNPERLRGEKTKAMIALERQLQRLHIEILDTENNLELTEEERESIEQEVETNDRLAPEEKRQLKAELIERRLEQLQSELLINNLPDPSDPNFEAEYAALLERISALVRSRNLSQERAQQLRTQLRDYFRGIDALDVESDKTFGKESLVQQALQSRIEPNEKQIALLRAMSNTEALGIYFYEKTELEGKTMQKAWDEFTAEVKDLVEEIFSSSLDSNPLELFERGWDPIHEGRFYKSLVKKLKDLGEEVSGYHGSDQRILRLKNAQIQMPTRVMLPSSELVERQSKRRFAGEDEPDITIGGKEEYSHLAFVNLSFGEAISSHLQKKIIDLKEVTEYFHNSEVISQLGLGWEQISKFAEKLSTSELTDLFTEDPEIALAYQLYIKSLHDWLAQRNRHVVNSFGEIDDATKLDQIQKMAFLQLCAIKGIDPSEINRSDDVNLIKEFRKIKRKIRMASGIAKGGTAEFWDAMLTSRMLVTYEQKEDEGRTEYSTAAPYTGGRHVGYEKMIASLDLDMLLERFGVPSHWPDFRYVFIPRDLAHAEDAWSDKWDHNDVYKWRPKLENARYMGRSDEVADFDDKYVILGDNLKTRCLDLMRRGGWRYRQYRVDIVRENGVINYEKTMQRMHRLGSYAVMRFINDHLGTRQLNGETKIDKPELAKSIVDQLALQSPYQQADLRYYGLLGTKDLQGHNINSFDDFVRAYKYALDREKEIEEFFKHKKRFSSSQQKERDTIGEYKSVMKRIMFEVEIFDRFDDIMPSHIVATQRRRYTPDSERTIFEELNQFLKWQLREGFNDSYIEGQIYPLFLSAVQVVERVRWEEAKTKWDDAGGTRNHLNYRLGIEDFTRADMRKKLESHFTFYKNTSPVIVDRQTGQRWSLSELSFEEYEGMLHGFFKQLRGGYDETYVRADDQDEKNQDQAGHELRRRRNTNYGISKRRYTRNYGGQEETLAQRFATMLETNVGELYHDIGGSDFDYSKFLIEQGGIRAHARMMGETNTVATGLNPALVELVNEHIAAFALEDISSPEKLVGAVKKHFGDPLKKAQLSIRDMDQDQADMYCITWMAFLERMLAKDRVFRTKFLGDFAEKLFRDFTGGQPTLIGDHFVALFERKVNQLDSDDWRTMYLTLSNELHLNMTEWRPHGSYQTDGQKRIKQVVEATPGLSPLVKAIAHAPIVGRYLQSMAAPIMKARPEFKRNKVFAGLIEPTTGLDGKTRFFETFLPIITVAVILAVIAMIWAAREKENEKK